LRIRITKDVWDDGADHHPPVLLARKGDVLNVLATVGLHYEVARNGRFYVDQSECEVIEPPYPTVSEPVDKVVSNM
jgi:hypothetical protein